jgi:hypothetical protein
MGETEDEKGSSGDAGSLGSVTANARAIWACTTWLGVVCCRRSKAKVKNDKATDTW